MAAHTAAHSAANPDQAARRAAERKAREAYAGPKQTPAEVEQLRNRQDGKCAYCLTLLKGNGHVDHMTPVAAGGTNALENLALACRQCNLEKHAKTALEYFIWRASRGLPLYESAYAYRIVYK